ncbi:rhodanese-like domain-containing protein [Enterococcus gallinarum]|uniref:rhodanese-like domain-containing protein n=1 Tax=Enterococcus gallinarum TaxID=1353 RepID=UPI0032E407EB
MYRSITMPEFYQASKKQKFHLIDVREVDEFISGHVPNAQNNPLSHFTTANLEKDLDYYVICHSGARSEQACHYMDQQGFKAINVLGGTSAWPGELV